MKRLLTILAIIQLTFSTAIAQDSNLGITQTGKNLTTSQLRVFNGGDAYVLKDWVLGKVIFGNGTAKYLPLNYNGFNDRPEWMSDGKPMTIDQPINAFILGDTSLAKGYLFQSGFYPIDDKTAYSFYQVLYDSPKGKVLKNIHYKTREKRNFNEANITVSFDLYETFYYANEARKLTKIKAKDKDIVELFPAKSSEIENYIKSEGVKIKTIEDAINLIAYAENL